MTAPDIQKKFAPAMDFQIDYDKSKDGYSMPLLHYHNLYELYFLEQGSRRLFINNDIYDTFAGSVYLIRPYVLHRSAGDTPFSGVCIHFSEHYLDKYFSTSAKIRFLNCFNKEVISLDADGINDFLRLSELMTNDPDWQFAYLPLIFRLLSKYTHLSQDCGSFLTHDKIPAILEYIDSNFSVIKGIDEVAKKFYISKNHLGYLFKKHTGTTFTNYVNTLKIQFSCYRLAQNRYSITQISEECGFESVTYFGRIFKKFMGCSPSEYRANHSDVSK